MIKLAVVGSRTFDDYDWFKDKLDKHISEFIHKKLEIVSGGAEGADTLAVTYAVKNFISYYEILPDWNKHGRSAGFIRNIEIAEYADVCFAFIDKPLAQSKGTYDTVKRFLVQEKHTLLFQKCKSYEGFVVLI